MRSVQSFVPSMWGGRSLVISSGDHGIFLRDPVSLGLLVLAAALMAISLYRELRQRATAASGARQ